MFFKKHFPHTVKACLLLKKKKTKLKADLANAWPQLTQAGYSGGVTICKKSTFSSRRVVVR